MPDNPTHTSEDHFQQLLRLMALEAEAEAEQTMLDFIKKHCAERTAPLAGNSIHHDRLFLRRYMPTLEAYLHYRIIDVSSVKELVRRWYPRTHRTQPPKKEDHRAMDDIRESLRELVYYRKEAFRPIPE